MRIYDYLEEYKNSDFYGFHMPGHKRNESLIDGQLPYGIDITEIEGFDDLHHATGMIKDAEVRAAKVYGAEETHFLVNGSTAGILSAILGVTSRGDEILVARNCHKSVYHALELNDLSPIYIYPEFDSQSGLNGEVRAEEIRKILEECPNIKAVMIVSPTYDGVVSDVKGIAEVVHEHGVPLIVDEAHGAHFGFHPAFPKNANALGADLVIHSVHKTLPALTQTALIHINGNMVDRKKVRKYLSIFQSSSPSYVLMSSIDACTDFLENKGQEAFASYVRRLSILRESLKDMKHLQLVRTEHFDISKVVISVQHANITSLELSKRLLKQYHLQMEMSAGNYILAMTSVSDTEEGIDRLIRALREIDESLKDETKKSWKGIPKATTTGEGKRAKNYIYLYPPGIPIVIPGEVITKEIETYLEMYKTMGFSIVGDDDE